MSLERVGQTVYMTSGSTKETWIDQFREILDRLEQHSVAYGGRIEWDSLELQSESEFIEQRTLLSKDSIYDQIRTLRVSALKVAP